MENKSKRWRLIVGEPAAETRATQMLAFAVNRSVEWASMHVRKPPRSHAVPQLLHAVARALTLVSLSAPEPPIEVVALSARNIFELYLRLRHILFSDANCQTWLEEAVTDQIQIYEGLLSTHGPESARRTLNDEIARLRTVAASKDLSPSGKILTARSLATEVGLKAEYDAFYKFYSKLVHPSSFSVNLPPVTVNSSVHRTGLVLNLQLYGNLVLDDLESHVGLPADDIRTESEQLYEALLSGPKH